MCEAEQRVVANAQAHVGSLTTREEATAGVCAQFGESSPRCTRRREADAAVRSDAEQRLVDAEVALAACEASV